MSFNFEIAADIQEIINNCADPVKSEEIAGWLADRCRERELPFTDYQWKSVINHVCAMINRSKSGELLEIDTDLFADVAEDSLQLSEKIVNMVGGIPDQEKYLLSIHFEGVKENI